MPAPFCFSFLLLVLQLPGSTRSLPYPEPRRAGFTHSILTIFIIIFYAYHLVSTCRLRSMYVDRPTRSGFRQWAKRFHRRRPSDAGRPPYRRRLQSCGPFQHCVGRKRCRRLRCSDECLHWQFHDHRPSRKRFHVTRRHSRARGASLVRSVPAAHNLRACGCRRGF
jgi:hypothetical protein